MTIMGDGWQAIAAPGSDPWIRVVSRADGLWFLVVEVESPAGGQTRIAEYGPIAAKRMPNAHFEALCSALASAPGGNVAGVLATFGLPDLPGMISTATAAEAVRKAREGRSRRVQGDPRRETREGQEKIP